MKDCANPEKHRYTSKNAARKAVKELHRNRAAGGPGRLHVYRCVGHWHVGHTEERKR